MQARSWTFPEFDARKAEWPHGPWDDEPDKVQWPDERTGFPCLAVRNHFGVWCGYVGVLPGNPYYGQPYQDLYDFHVHGGLTFAGSCSPEGPEGRTICHAPDPGEPDDVWWFGFDCGHARDLSPYLQFEVDLPFDVPSSYRAPVPLPVRETYRDLGYVHAECANLARQLCDND
jgi:hypothetical protein